MAALELGERVPMSIKQLREYLCFHFAVLKFFVAPLVLRIVLRFRMDRRYENNVFPIRRPDAAVGAGRNRSDLMWFPNQPPRFGVEVAHPDLRRIGRLRCPDQPFAVRRKARPLLMVWRLIESLRFSAASRHDPQMRNLRVRLKIDIY